MGIPIAVAAIYVGGWLLAALLALCAVLSARELFKMAELKNAFPIGWVGIGVGTLALAVGGFALWLEEAMECDPGEC